MIHCVVLFSTCLTYYRGWIMADMIDSSLSTTLGRLATKHIVSLGLSSFGANLEIYNPTSAKSPRAKFAV